MASAEEKRSVAGLIILGDAGQPAMVLSDKPTASMVVSDEPISSPQQAEPADPQPSCAPPPSAERLLCYLLPKRQRDAILGDLAEEYTTDLLPKYGRREARRMYWAQFLRSIAATLPPLLWAAILGAVGWLWSKLGN